MSNSSLRHQMSSLTLRHQAFRSALRHQASSLILRHPAFRLSLRHQVWLITHVRNPEGLIGLIYPSDRPSRLGLSISFGIMSPSERSVGLVYPIRLTLWKNENFLLLVPDILYVCHRRSKGLEFGKDTWSEAHYGAFIYFVTIFFFQFMRK